MSARVEDGFRHRFRELLALVRPKRLEFGVDLLMRRAAERARREGLPAVRALARVYEETRRRVARRLELTGSCSLVRPPWTRHEKGDPPRFLCDESLGGLARWLRAAGYEARRAGPLSLDRVVARAEAEGLVLLTSDSAVHERRAYREERLEALWVPTGLARVEQLALVLRDLGLRPREARCMACGGALVQAKKEEVRARIPPRTALWKDEYFLCAACDRLFWQGTHWERISGALAAAAGP